MTKTKIFSAIVLILVIVAVFTSLRVAAQEDVVHYLKSYFEEQRIPVSEIAILESSPLRLRIIVQSVDEWTNIEDTIILNAVDRAVFVHAHEKGYVVESLVRILQDNQGRQLDYTEKSVDFKQIEKILNQDTLHLALTDKETKEFLTGKIEPFLDEYNLHGNPIVFEVASVDGYQTLTLEMKTDSLDVANNAAFFFWSLPHFALFDDANIAGASIALYRARITDENGDDLFDYIYDFQLGSGGWTQDERLQPLGGGESEPSDLPVETPINNESLATETLTALPLPTETPSPTETPTSTDTPSPEPSETPAPTETPTP